VGVGIPEYEANRYEGRVKHGGILLSVHCDDEAWVKRAEDVLKHVGAEDIASAGEAHADFARSDKPLPRTRSAIGGDTVVSDVTDTTDIVEDPHVRTTGSGTTYEP
jgi:hypothetical protein